MKVRSSDQDLMGVQEQTQGLVKYLAQLPILDGNLIEDIELTSGTAKSVQHQLGRSARGYFVTKKSANAVVWDSVSSQPDRELLLNASASCSVSIWVF